MTAAIVPAILVTGLAIILAGVIKVCLRRLSIPAVVGYIILGFCIRLIDGEFEFLTGKAEQSLDFLAYVGVTVLLFKVGLESKLHQLLKQLGNASIIGLTCIVVSGIVAFACAHWIIHLDLLTSLVLGTALTATSVGMVAAVWEESAAIETGEGQLLLDVAELDDIIGVVLMALLFNIAPVIAAHNTQGIGEAVLKTSGAFAVKLALFGLLCVLFALYAEKPLRSFFQQFEKPPEMTLVIISIGFVIAAVAGILGFSLAIGAFFAGLIFSRDPASIKSQTAFDIIYDLFSPFFFIGIGLGVRLGSLTPALWPAAVLVAAAFAGKFLGSAVPARICQGLKPSVLLGLSMIPRAEVAMIITQRSRNLAGNVMPDRIFTAMVITCLVSCIVPPTVLKTVIPRWLGIEQ
jgi:Kef-type K+ transport system membrane component KefB